MQQGEVYLVIALSSQEYKRRSELKTKTLLFYMVHSLGEDKPLKNQSFYGSLNIVSTILFSQNMPYKMVIAKN